LLVHECAGTVRAAGKCFLDMLGVFAEFETNLKGAPGIADAKARRPKGPQVTYRSHEGQENEG